MSAPSARYVWANMKVPDDQNQPRPQQITLQSLRSDLVGHLKRKNTSNLSVIWCNLAGSTLILFESGDLDGYLLGIK